ncbi:MAG TPA: FtsX-like permease family protein [Candidatus Acidoferrales bacterium]|nr:FtsX-like permease family protein [Candidatus Acidoferrales bacterium]
MRGPAGLGWRALRRRPLRTALTVIGIAIGVGLVFGALSVDGGGTSGAAGYAGQVAGRADLVVHAFGEGTLSSDTLAVVADTPGVLETSPQVRRPTFATGAGSAGEGSAPGRGAGTPLGPVTVVGVDPVEDRALHDEALAAGTFLSGGDTVDTLVTQTWARSHVVGVGSRISLVGPGGERTFTVRGELAPSGPALSDGGAILLTAIDAARALFAVPAGGADLVEVRVDPALGAAAVETRLDARLTTQPYVLSTAADEAAAVDSAARDVGSALLLVAVVVLFVGALLVSDTLAMSVAERTREVGLLRSAGATRGQVHRMVLAEALWLGIAGTVVGIALGGVFAVALAPVVASITSEPVAGTGVDASSLVVAFTLGLLVTLAAALEPAWRAGRVAPVEALRRGRPLSAPAWGVRRAAAAGVVAALVGVGVLIAGGWTGGIVIGGQSGSGSSSAVAILLTAVGGAAGILVLLFLTGLAAPIVLRAAGVLFELAALPVRRRLGAEVRLARGALAHDPGRVAVTFAALTVGLGLVVGLAGVADGTRRAGEAWINDVAPADFAVVAISPVPDDFGIDLAAVAGVVSVTPVRLFDVAIAGRLASAVAVNPAAYAGLGALTVVGGSRQAAFAALAAGGAALVPQSVADRFGLRVGDQLEMRTAQGAAGFRVAAIVSHSLPGSAGESVVVSQTDATRSLGIAGASMFLVRAGSAAGAGPASTAGAGSTASAGHASSAGLAGRLSDVADRYALSVVRPSAVGGAVGDALDRTFGLLDLLALAGVIVAALCIVDVLAMDVGQRVGELGVLRAAGLTRRQAWRTVVLEAGILGLAGALLGAVVGVIGSAVVLVGGGTVGIGGALEVPWQAVALVVLLGLVGSGLAAAYPARLASRVQIAQALRAE